MFYGEGDNSNMLGVIGDHIVQAAKSGDVLDVMVYRLSFLDELARVARIVAAGRAAEVTQ